jgi:carboxyl-terminal processing protease
MLKIKPGDRPMFVLGVVALLQQATASVPPTKWNNSALVDGAGYVLTTGGSALDTAGATVTLKSTGVFTAQFGMARASEPATTFTTANVRVSGKIKTTNATDGAALWLRIENDRGMALKLDNGQLRAIKGTTGWTHFETTLPIAPGAKTVVFGVLLFGTGEAEVRKLRLEPQRSP